MKRFKHSKYKNTGILFELLIRQVVSDTLNEKSSSRALYIVKEHFGKKTELLKEFKLYKNLISESFDSENKANEFLSIILDARSKLNETVLSREKYNLIKEIKRHYSIDEFFNYRVSNYKENASAYKLFSYTKSDNPKEFIDNKSAIIEHISKSDTKIETPKSKLNEEYNKQPKEIRLLAWKLLVDSFNTKYTVLSKSQKTILREYINSVDNTEYLKEFVGKECSKISNAFGKLNITDPVVKIKINEVLKLVDKIKSSKVITESEILSILRYHDLYKEVKRNFK
jgi:hypothetical protein